MQPKELRVSVPGPRIIAGKVWGNAGDEKVVCIHGMSSNAGCFDSLIEAAAKAGLRRQWLALDLAGCGRSSRLPPGTLPSWADYVADVARVTKALQWDSFALLAHSIGTHVALYFAGLFPDRVTVLVGVDFIPGEVILDKNFLLDRVHIVLTEYLAYEERDDLPAMTRDEAMERIRRSRFSDISTASAEKLLERSGTLTDDGHYKLSHDRRTWLSLARQTTTLDTHKALLGAISCPILFVLSTSHRHVQTNFPTSVSTFAALEAALGSKMTTFVVEGDHDMIMEQPDKVAGPLVKFLKQQAKL